jgi:heavy metal sensor kinase
MRGLSIRVRLTLTYTLVLGIFLYSWSVVLYRIASARLFSQVDLQLEERETSLRPFFNVAHDDVTWLFDRNEVERSSLGFAHAVFDAQGRFLDGSGLASVFVFPFTDSARQALEAHSSRWETFSLSSGHRVRALNRAVTGSDGNTYLFRVGTLLDQTEEDLRQLAFALTLLVPLTVLAGAGAGWWMAGQSLRPVAAITKTAQQITASSLSERLPLRGTGDELDQLSLTLNEMVARLQGSFEQMSQFISNVSHELRTPLAALRGSCEITLRTARSDDAFRKVLAGNIEELDRLTRTVSDLLAIARAEAGQIPLRRRSEDLGELVRDVAESMRVLAAERGISLDCKISGDVRADVDGEYLLRLLLNLIDNAIKYNRPQGLVEVSLLGLQDAVHITVRDTGRGIPPEELPRVFERFFRGHPDGRESAGGAGLGLSMVRWIATAHGGHVDVQSRAGEGTAFRVVLPRAAAGAAAVSTQPSSGLPTASAAPSTQLSATVPHGASRQFPLFAEGSITMPIQVVRWSYWLGMFCAAVALLWRGLVALGLPERIHYGERTVGYAGFLNGAVLFLLIATATASFLWAQREKN